MRRMLASILTMSFALSGVPAFASEADAKDFFARGRELRAKGDCAGAVPLFRKAWELYPGGLGSLRNLAECEEQLGHYASSRRAWLDLKRALLVNKDAKYDAWDADADAAATRLAPKIARLTITIVQRGSDGEGPLADAALKVSINGDALDRKLLDVALDRDPGSYRVRVEGGKEPVEKEINLNAGDNKSVKLVVDLVDKPKDDKQPPPKDDPPKIDPPKNDPAKVDGPEPSNAGKTAGYIALGVGGAAAIGTGVMLILRQGALSDLKAACPAYESSACTGPRAADARDAVDRGKSAAMLTNVFGAVAIVGIGAGIILLVTAPSKSEAPRARSTVRLTPWAGAGGGGAFLSGEF